MRRKRRACFLFFVNLIAYLQQLPVREIWVKPRANLFWCIAEDQWTENDWVGNLRMSKVTFQKLCEELAPFIERRDTNYRKAISLRERVAITLGNFRSGTRQFCDAAGSNFSQKKRPAHAHAYRFTASRGVEDVSQRDLASCRKRE